jgi:hypothetical protein
VWGGGAAIKRTMGWKYKNNKYRKEKRIRWKAQSRQSARLSLQSSEFGPAIPLPADQCCPPPTLVSGGKHSLAGEGVYGPNSNEGTDTVVL